jgi:hypothetical protein
LNASTPYTNQPQGTFPRGSNLLLTKRGGLRVTDGSTTYTLQNGIVKVAVNPICDVLLLQLPGGSNAPILIGLLKDTTPGSYKLVYLVLGTYDIATYLIGNITGILGTPQPQLLQFNDQVIIIMGNQNPMYYWCGYQHGNGIGQWAASTIITANTVIYKTTTVSYRGPFGTITTTYNYIFKATAVIGDQKTGSTIPTFNNTLGSSTLDNNVTWTCLGADTPAPIINTFQVTYPQWVANLKVNANYVIQVGFYNDNATPPTTWLLSPWQASTDYATDYIIDPNNNVQQAVGGGKSGIAPPIAWGTTLGATTKDNNITWGCFGPATFFNFTAIQSGTTGAGPSLPATMSPTPYTTAIDNNVVWENTGANANSALPPRGATTAVVYAGSLWVFNTSPFTTADGADGPTCLRMSELNNPNSWNPINAAFLGKDDGTVGVGLATFTIAESGITPTGSLVVFKDYSTFQIIGIFGSTTFEIIQAQTDLGCSAAATIQFLPGYGIGRLTHLGFAIFNGVRDQLISEEIRPYIFGGEPDITPVDAAYISQCWGVQVTQPPMYVAACPMPGSGGGLTRLFCYDLILKAWTAPVDLPWPINCLRQLRQTGNGLDVPTVSGGFSDGSVRRLFLGTSWADTPSVGVTQPVTWSVRSPEVFGKSVADGLYTRALYVRGIGAASGLTAAITSDAVPVISQPMKVMQRTNGEFEAWLPMHTVGKQLHVDLNGSGPGEIFSFDWDADPAPATPAVLI